MRKRIIFFLIISAGCVLFPAQSQAEDPIVDEAWATLEAGNRIQAQQKAAAYIKKFKAKADQRQGDILEKRLQKGITKVPRRTIKALSERGDAAALGAATINTEDALPRTIVSGQIAVLGYKELNAVAEAQYIRAEALRKEGKKQEAKAVFQELINSYPDAYGYDPKGWFWNVAAVAQDKIDLLETPYDYEDYQSQTLAKKAWECL